MYPFERFSEEAKQSLTFAQEEAERSHHSYIGTEHLLLGLLRVTSGTAYRVLTSLGIRIDQVREVIKSVLGSSERILIQQIIPTSRVKRVIELSFEEARRTGHSEVDTGDLLMGLLIEGDGIAAHVLQDLGATQDKVRLAMERDLSTPPADRPKVEPSRPLRPPGRKQSQLGPPTAQMTAGITGSSDASDLLRLLRSPAIARLLKARGVDTQALSRQLAQPPTTVLELRSKLAVAGHAMQSAVQVQDFELAAKLREQIRDLTGKLANAEQEWVDSLS